MRATLLLLLPRVRRQRAAHAAPDGGDRGHTRTYEAVAPQALLLNSSTPTVHCGPSRLSGPRYWGQD